MDSSIDDDKYERIERWCQSQIDRGADWFFDPTLFRSTLREKAKEWNIRYEVRFVADKLVWLDIVVVPNSDRFPSPSPSPVPSLLASKLAFVSRQSHGTTYSKECSHLY
jgi:hypothetical protein